MPPKKLPPKAQQPEPAGQNGAKPAAKPQKAPARKPQAIPDEEIKKQSSLNATMALEATKKAYELRQAAYGAGDPNAREEILAKAINKEIEAESFGKAAKYTRSGAFQGLAAGAGLGVQPGVTLGKLTGALVGGLVSTVGGLLGGGIGSAYGAMSGPFWDLGEMASHGVRSIVGDFPNWEATSSQKKALEKMVLGAQKTPQPSEDELEQMRDDNGGATSADYQDFAQNVSSWIPGMPKMPSMPSIPGFGGQSSGQAGAKVKPSQKSQPVQKQRPTTRSASNQQPAQKPANNEHRQTTPTKRSSETQKTNGTAEKKKPKKLGPKTGQTTSAQQPVKQKPAKLENRARPATASA